MNIARSTDLATKNNLAEYIANDMSAAKTAAAVIGVIVTVLLIIGALNWGWLGLTGYNVVGELNNATFQSSYLERTIYVLVGVAGILALVGVVVGAAKHKEVCASVMDTMYYRK